jgi:hypothetical protein
MRLTNIFLFLFISFVLAGSYVWGQDAQVSASVNTDTVGVQDQFQYIITVSGKDSGDAEIPRFSNPADFRIVSGPNVSSQFQWINGRSSSSKRFIYVLIPEKEGQFTIDPVEVRVGDKTYKTQPLQVRVTSAAANPPPRSQPQPRRSPFDPFSFDPFEEERAQNREPIGDSVFARAELDRSSAYIGQQVTLFYKIYTQVRLTGVQIQESPALSGFWVEDLTVEKNPKGESEVINGREYHVFTIKKQALFPTAAGKIKIPSSIFAVSAATAGDFFSIFGNEETIYRKTQELLLDVKELPASGRPADFSNAVGSFKLDADIDKTEAATGEAIALHIRLKGQGNLKMIPDISVPSFPDFTVYSSKRSDTSQVYAQNRMGGEKTWEYVIVPKAPGRQTIPSISFSYFDPEQGKYETVSTPVMNLNVVRGADNAGFASGLSGGEKQNLIRRGIDINFIKLSPGNLESRRDFPFYRSLWFYLIAAVPLAFNAGAFFYQKQRSRRSEKAGLFRSQRAKSIAFKRLKAAEKAGRTDARHFYDQAAAALSGYLIDRFNLAEIELTGDTLERMLSERGVSREITEESRACLQECDFGRFVSATESAEKMSELNRRIRNNIGALEKATAAAVGA